MTPASGAITHVSDTAFWVAFYRAMESERPDALFHDPFARRLAGERGEAIVNAMPNGRSLAWPMIVRTCVMDELLLQSIERDGVDVVINLAAGLDARPYRMKLPPTLRWVEIDLPAMIEHKRRVLANDRPVCALESIELDLSAADTRRSVFERVGTLGRRVLVLSEGLLIYLEPDQVAALAADLHRPATFAQWLLDIASPALLKRMASSWGRVVEKGGTPFRFAPAEGTQFFASHGWVEAEFRSMWVEALRLKRTPPMAWLWKLLGVFTPPKKREEFRRFSGIVLMKRA